MAEGKKRWSRWQKVGLGLALALLIPLLAFTGFRRAWIRPLPNVRMTVDAPIVQELALPPDSCYHLLGRAMAVPPPLRAFTLPYTRVTSTSTKLREHAWPELPESEIALPTSGTSSAFPELRGFNPKTPWTAEECRELLRVAEARKPYVALLDQALATPLPPLLVPEDDGTSGLLWGFGVRELAEWLIVSAEYHRARGDLANCFRDLRRLWSMSAVLERGRLASDPFANQPAVESAWYASTRHDVDAGILKQTAVCALRSADDCPSVADQLRLRAAVVATGIAEAHDDGLLLRHFVFENFFHTARAKKFEGLAKEIAPPLAWLAGSTRSAMQRHMSDFGCHAVAIAEAPYSAKTVPTYEALAPRPADKKEIRRILVSVRDPMGYLFATDHVSFYAGLHCGYVENQTQLRGIALFLAIKAYEKDNGRIPDTLIELVPQYLPRVPRDPYDGKPFRYLKHGVPGLLPKAWAVYSIGYDFADDGGKGDGFRTFRRIGSSPPSDIVWPSVPYPVPPPSGKSPPKP